MLLLLAAAASAQQAGSIRGMIYDKDFDAPLPLAKVTIVETGESVTATEQGNYVFGEVAPGQYTLIFSKPGYTRQVRTDIVVNPGQLTDVDAYLGGEFTEMDEFIVQDLQIGGGTEADLLILRAEVPQLLDSISADLMSQAGAGDVAAALRLVSGATVQDGKYAVIRGLPDRYVNSQMNGVRLPTADPDKRAVQLDQFPSDVVESVQVSKTFTPDQQGDASGGAVNVVLKGIPQTNLFSVSVGTGINTQAYDSDFLTYKGGGVSFWGDDEGSRAIIGIGDSDDPVGVSRGSAPVDYNWSIAAGGRHEFDTGFTVGGYANLFYDRSSSFHDNGIDDSYWVNDVGQPMTPQTPQDEGADNFKTALYDITEGSEQVQWGALTTLGLESDNHSVIGLYMYTRVAEDQATLAEDTRGKQRFFSGHDPYDDTTPGHAEPFAAPYIRTETLRYTERTTETFQLHGKHTLPLPELSIGEFLRILPPEFDWTYAQSSSRLYEPDKRQFGSFWTVGRVIIPGVLEIPASHRPFTPAVNFTLGNLQRTWRDVSEESDQYFMNLKLPFEQWSGSEGYIKLGLFHDQVMRTFDQESFSNFNEPNIRYEAPWEEFWSEAFPSEVHLLSGGPPFVDVDYEGRQEISAWYWMMDLPLTGWLNAIAGIRYESTELTINNQPEANANWLPPSSGTITKLNPGDADVSFMQDDVLPSVGFVFAPTDQIKLRGTYSQTIARQTFKELTPIQQQEFLGGDVFVGNPNLTMSALKNYDLRLDYTPYQGGLLSISWFYKEIEDPIEYVQRNAGFTYTTPVNYPTGELMGYEFEVRQDMGHFWDHLQGLSIGGNATLIDSEVTLPADEAAGFTAPNIQAPMPTRDMTNAPEYLYNLYVTYDIEQTGTKLGLFYSVKGDTLVAGAGQSDGNFVPSLYAREYGTLNFSLSQMLGKHFKLKFSAKNLTDPKIEEVYRSQYIDGDVVKTSYTKGIDLSVSLSASFEF